LRQIGWIERQVRRADRFQQRHVVLAFPWAVAQKFGNDQAGGKAALMAYYGLFALFPLLLLLLATILGFALSGSPALREQLIDSALGTSRSSGRICVRKCTRSRATGWVW
jgi:uncharacterized BrkB/YihY/UPF0761 family membrane protein